MLYLPTSCSANSCESASHNVRGKQRGQRKAGKGTGTHHVGYPASDLVDVLAVRADHLSFDDVDLCSANAMNASTSVIHPHPHIHMAGATIRCGSTHLEQDTVKRLHRLLVQHRVGRIRPLFRQRRVSQLQHNGSAFQSTIHSPQRTVTCGVYRVACSVQLTERAVETSAPHSSLGRKPSRNVSFSSVSINSSCTSRSASGKLFDVVLHVLAWHASRLCVSSRMVMDGWILILLLSLHFSQLLQDNLEQE